jgi:hypothetical protein
VCACMHTCMVQCAVALASNRSWQHRVRREGRFAGLPSKCCIGNSACINLISSDSVLCCVTRVGCVAGLMLGSNMRHGSIEGVSPITCLPPVCVSVKEERLRCEQPLCLPPAIMRCDSQHVCHTPREAFVAKHTCSCWTLTYTHEVGSCLNAVRCLGGSPPTATVIGQKTKHSAVR